MLSLTRQRAYYILRELECVSCRTKEATRLYINGERMVDDSIDVDDSAVVEAFCINCADKAATYRQNERRRALVNEAIKLMHLREAAKISTRYDAYRDEKKSVIPIQDVYRIMESMPCEVCGRTDADFPRGREEQAVRGFVMWPYSPPMPLVGADVYATIDAFRDCVWLCPEHYTSRYDIKLSFSFDENFYKRMRALYYT